MLIMLTYTVSFLIQPLFKLNIHNQCLNVVLASLTYITDDLLVCHRVPDHKVYAGDTMRSGFIIKPYCKHYGVLIYRLQRKQTHEYIGHGKSASRTMQLLVVWEIFGFNELYADVLLAEHDIGFKWNENNLGKLYHKNGKNFRLSPCYATESWSLDDNTALMVTSKTTDEDYILNITISEVEINSNTRTPAHIDLKRQVVLEIMIVVVMR
jgi:hypothetical protein